jgi:hypothetical protein
MKQRMKLEATKVKEKYAQKEADLIKRQAVIQANLKILSVKRKVEEAEGKLGAISDSCTQLV